MEDSNLNRKLGPYRLLRLLGRGGMGTVYAVQDEDLQQMAAIKMLSPSLAADAGFRERFAAEIESLKQLQHPNIVKLLAFGEQDEQLYYVMELVEGKSLQEELRCGRRFSWREVTRIAIDICAALKHAHDHGIIHRDLKPANLLLTNDDQVKLFDFGIAKLFGATEVTTDGVMGTADYMAPEQSEGKPVGPRTDLYSLGSVIYALLCGRPPFSGNSIVEVVNKVRFEPPVPIGRLADDVPVELEHLVEQLLQKSPARRVPTAIAVTHRLKAMEHALSVRPDDADDDQDAPPEASSPEDMDRDISNRPTIQLPEGQVSAQDMGELKVTTGDKPKNENRFTRVSDEPADAENRSWLPLLLFLVAVSAGSVVAFFLVRHWRKPPTADRLYARISQIHDLGNSRQIGAGSDIERFLKLYPDDARHDEVAALQESIQIRQLQRRLEIRALLGGRSDSPLEELYLYAIRQIDLDPERTAAELQALVDVYEDDPSLSQHDGQCLKLAQRQLVQMKRQVASQSDRHLDRLRNRLEFAGRIEAEDPATARRIYHGIIALYGHRAWASGPVGEARHALSGQSNANGQ